MGVICLYAAIAGQLNVRATTNQVGVARPPACRTRRKNKEHMTCLRIQIHECEVGAERGCTTLACHCDRLPHYSFGRRLGLIQNQTVES